MFGKDCYKDITELLNLAFEEKKRLIAVHRGVWGGNIIENTAISCELSREAGADMFEIDVSISTDGILYAFHDGGENRMFHIAENMETLSSAEIDKLIYYNSVGHPSGVHVETLESIIACLKNGELYNIDRAWNKLPETVAILNKYPWAIRQALIKSPVREDVLAFLNTCPDKYMYMPIVYSMEEVALVLSYPEINTVGMELIADSEKHELFQNQNIEAIHSKQLFTWVNAITLGKLPEHTLYGGLDDDAALKISRDGSWGELLRKGIDIIQTDWPRQLQLYRDQYVMKGWPANSGKSALTHCGKVVAE